VHLHWFCVFPFRGILKKINFLFREAFGEASKHEIFADFKTIEEEPEPSFYIHVVQKM
jgi:hypothetical protein